MSEKKTIALAIGGAALVVLAGIGGVVWALKSGYLNANPAAQAEPAPIVVEAPIYVKIPPFTVNIVKESCGGSSSGACYSKLFYVGLSYRVENKETESFLTEHMPELRSRLLMVMSEQDPDKILTKQGKADVAQKLLELVKEPFTNPQPELKVADVMFNEFIVQ
ncbi:flagellar basal body-associated FliL family protein [Pseudomonas aeruginosa]